jgi:hypothetical protein
VHLFWPKDREQLKGAFKALPVDLYYELLHSFRKTTRIIRANAPQVYQGNGSTLYFFKFNPAHPLLRDMQARQEFAFIVQEAFKDLSLSDTTSYDNQFIPEGYAGHLSPLATPPVAITRLRGQAICVLLSGAFKETHTAVTKLVDTAASVGVTLTVGFNDDAETNGAIPLAIFQSFKGNQRDALGSWSFLYSEEFGGLGPFRAEVDDIFHAVARTNSATDRMDLLLALHRRTIENAYGVPFMAEATSILASNRVSLGHINPFDLRLRFYDVIWK